MTNKPHSYGTDGTDNTDSTNGTDAADVAAGVDYDDHRRPLLRALKLGAVSLIVITLVSLMVWGYFRDLPGIWGVLLGAGIGGGFVMLTAISVLLSAGTNPTTTGAVVLGGWLLKIVVIIGVFIVIRDLDFYDHTALFSTVVLALIVVLGSEAYGVVTTKVTYVN